MSILSYDNLLTEDDYNLPILSPMYEAMIETQNGISPFNYDDLLTQYDYDLILSQDDYDAILYGGVLITNNPLLVNTGNEFSPVDNVYILSNNIFTPTKKSFYILLDTGWEKVHLP